MRVVGRILLVIVMVIGVLLVVAGTATLVGADGWTGKIDDISINFNIDSGVFKEAGDGGVAMGLVLLAASIITNLRTTDFISWEIGSSD